MNISIVTRKQIFLEDTTYYGSQIINRFIPSLRYSPLGNTCPKPIVKTLELSPVEFTLMSDFDQEFSQRNH